MKRLSIPVPLRHGRRWWLALLGVLALMVVNETTYRQSHHQLTRGIRLTDLRIQAARLLQVATDAETGVRGYLLTAKPAYLAPYQAAQIELPRARAEAEGLVIELGGADANQAIVRVRELLDAKLGELRTVIELHDKGQREQAVSVILSDVGKDKMDALRAALDDMLQRAARTQQGARSTLYDALALNRAAVHAASLLALLGLVLADRRPREPR